MSKKIVLAGALILSAPIFGASNAALAIDCRALPDLTVKGKWSVETVDGKICWFQGDSGTPKEELRWPGRAGVESKTTALAYTPEKSESKKSADSSKREQAEPKKSAATSKREQAEAKKSAGPSKREQAETKKSAASRTPEKKDEPKKLASLAKPERAAPEKLASSPDGQKIQCHAEVDKSKGGRWSWRTVDNRQCWFVGGRDTPREQLQWPPQERAAPSQDDASLQRRPQQGERPGKVELFSDAGQPKAVNVTPVRDGESHETASVSSWQIVNQESDGDLEFLAKDAWVALMHIDMNLGKEFLTHVPMESWPVQAEREPLLDRIATAPRGLDGGLRN